MTYAEWADYHCTLFGFVDPKQLAAVKAWVNVFRTGNFTPQELRLASDAVLVEGAGFWSDHPGKMVAFMNRQRAVASRDHDGDASRIAACPHCGNSGRLMVPHPACLSKGSWRPLDAGAGPTFYTAAVRCRCERGRAGRFTAPRVGSGDVDQLDSLDDYERANFPAGDRGRWRRLMAERAQFLAEMAAIGPVASLVDTVLDRLRNSMRQPGDDGGAEGGGA